MCEFELGKDFDKALDELTLDDENITKCPYRIKCDNKSGDGYCRVLNNTRFFDKHGIRKACPFWVEPYKKHQCRDCIYYDFVHEWCKQIKRKKHKDDGQCAKFRGRT